MLLRVAVALWRRRKSLPPMLTITNAGLCFCSKPGRRASASPEVSPEMPPLTTFQPVRRASTAGEAVAAEAPTPDVSETPRASTGASGGNDCARVVLRPQPTNGTSASAPRLAINARRLAKASEPRALRESVIGETPAQTAG